MKALVKTQAGPGLELMDVPMPEVGPNDVLIKIHKTAICGTDLHIWNWDKWAQQTIPVGMHVGHEFCGVIESVGSSITEYKPGEIVSGEGHCGPQEILIFVHTPRGPPAVPVRSTCARTRRAWA